MKSIFCATFSLKNGVDENEFLEVSNKAPSYYRKAPGFVSFNTVKLGPNYYANVEVWESEEAHDDWAKNYWPEMHASDDFRKWESMVEEIRSRTRGVVVVSSTNN